MHYLYSLDDVLAAHVGCDLFLVSSLFSVTFTLFCDFFFLLLFPKETKVMKLIHLYMYEFLLISPIQCFYCGNKFNPNLPERHSSQR